ncbi:hypothetical protein [Necropsobacter massiliensis]|uniref:hypothetical protein n=1 Tax=Necropsobacter massiliensis TaxID=1400001 RepID=UPI00065F9F49|nr:hypothetical protein [Necropsobacter massiliensis]
MYQRQAQRIFTEQDFKQLLINRSDIEKALDLKIELQKSSDEQYLEDYALFPEIHLHDVICIFLGLHPEDINATQHPRYNVIYAAISQQAEKGLIKSTIEYDINGNLTAIFIPHSTARNIANSRGYEWNVPPYRNLVENENLSKPDILDTAKDLIIAELRAEKAKNEQLQAENEGLKAENAELKVQPKQSAVDSESILELENQLAEKDKIIEELREQLQQKPNNTASDNKKNAFIKSLLFIHYGEQVAENPRPYIYDPNSSEKSKDGVIQKSFELSGLDKHLPSGRTLQNWIKSVDL